MIVCNCRVCNKKFLKKNSDVIKYHRGKYCSKKCMGYAQRGINNPHAKEKIKKTCLYCHKDFFVIPSLKKSKYCSFNCKKISATLVFSFRCLTCGIVFITHSARKRKFCSRKCYSVQKDKNPNWRGGSTKLIDRIRNSERYVAWRKEIFERDKYTCVWCGKNRDINADHIFPISSVIYILITAHFSNEEIFMCDLLWNIHNGRTLCVECHRKTKTYGSKALTCTISL